MSDENKPTALEQVGDAMMSALDEAQARTLTVEEEAIREVFARMPWGQKFTLADGSEVAIERFYEPRQGDGGAWQFGFDVKCEAFHLEFTVERTGWGRDVSAMRIEAPDGSERVGYIEDVTNNPRRDDEDPFT